MARIRTVKPDIAKHELLFQLERELGMPVRFAWALLPTQCDREGRFKWRPNALKSDLLPYDDVDFSRVLDAWVSRRMVVKYRVGDEWYGCIPTWKKHQWINNREADSDLPSLEAAEEVSGANQDVINASVTRQSRVKHAPLTEPVHSEADGEGKGKDIAVVPTAAKARRTKARTPIPEDLPFDEGMRDAATKRYPDADADEMFRQFVAFHAAKGSLMANWRQAWTSWLGNADKFGYPKRRITGSTPHSLAVLR